MLKPWMNGRYGHIANFNEQQEGDPGAGGGSGGGDPAGGTGGGETVYEAANYVSDAKSLDHPIFDGAKSVDDVVRIAVEQNAKVGVGNLQMPGEGATTEEMDAFYKQLGRPDDFKDYGFGAPKKDDKGNDIAPVFEEQVIDGFKGAFHRAGLSSQQADTLYAELEGVHAAQDAVVQEQLNEMHTQTEQMLKQKYGAALPQKMQGMQNAVRAVAGEGAAEIEQLLEDPRFGSDPRIMSFLMNLGEKLSEPSLRGGTPSASHGSMDPATAREEANKIIGDTKSPYWDSSHPQHKAVRDKVQNLFALANPEE